MELRPDGTIVIDLPRRSQKEDGSWETTAEVETVTLRRPVLDELFALWTALDDLGKDGDQPGEPAADDRTRVQGALVNMRNNAQWVRQAIVAFGTPQVYFPVVDAETTETGETAKTRRKVKADTNGHGELRLREDLAEPSWFASATAAGRILAHWQEIPLGPGVALVR